jgi:hypothetical protein
MLFRARAKGKTEMVDDSDPSRRDVMRTVLAVGAVSSGLVPSPADAAGSAPRPERAQHLIDRIAAIRLASPSLDEQRVEAAMQQALDAAGVARRPLRWFADSISAHRQVYMVAYAAARRAAHEAPGADLDTLAWNAAMESTWDRAWRTAHHQVPKAAHRASVVMRREDKTARERRRDALLAGYAAGRTAAHQPVLDAAFHAASSAAQEVAHRASTAAHKAPPRGPGGDIDKAAAWATWRATARRSGPWLAHDGAINAVAELAALQAFDHPAQTAAAALFRPLVDAMEAGLFCYWVSPLEVICVPRPALHVADGDLPREDRPPVAWASGETHASISTIAPIDLEDLKLLPWPMT